MFLCPYTLFKKKKIFLFERESKGGRGRERERETISSRLRTVSREPDAGLRLTNREIMT